MVSNRVFAKCEAALLLVINAFVGSSPSLRSSTRSLDSTGSNHLLLEVLLVLADGAVPAGHGLVLADHDVLGDLVEQSGISC